MSELLCFFVGMLFVIFLLGVDLEDDGCADWIGKEIQICKQENPND